MALRPPPGGLADQSGHQLGQGLLAGQHHGHAVLAGAGVLLAVDGLAVAGVGVLLVLAAAGAVGRVVHGDLVLAGLTALSDAQGLIQAGDVDQLGVLVGQGAQVVVAGEERRLVAHGILRCNSRSMVYRIYIV